MEKQDSEIVLLKEKIELVLAKKMKVPADFDFLSGAIWERIHERVSASTLKRIWGYVGKNIVARESTLDILSRFLNYRNWDDFVESSNASEERQSDIVLTPYIRTQDLMVSQKIDVSWKPNRHCVFEYLGGMQYKVLVSENSHLRVGDTFCCGIFVIGEAMILDSLVQNGAAPVRYIIGSSDGLDNLRIIK
ncbi:MAG: hypothetical protein IK117_08155 [Bacteroidales bacterium]|nr:hypothetical protein [Bacteroidales bacterium]